MGFNRRTFLQQAVSLLILGASQSGLTGRQRAWAASLDRYIETLAQPSTRKLALLVGINQYPNGTNLSGCVTDVELQRELLVNRFGFHPQDVITLSESQATRDNIESAFLEHLTEQAGTDDIVVFHFSGYGSKVKTPPGDRSESGDRLVNSLMPIDGVQDQLTNGLLEETLLLLAQTLSTERLTLVLDTSYKRTEKRLQGNLRVRSYPQQSVYPLNPQALAFQEQLRQNYFRPRPKPLRGALPGIVLWAASEDQVATEAIWPGFSAGLFTYALTQSLWQATPASTITVSLRQTVQQVESLMERQQPQLKGNKQPLLTYYQPPQISVGAEGVITAVDDQTIQLLLAGLPARILENYGVNSCLTLVLPPEETASTPMPQSLLQIRSREGLKAKARWLGTPNDSLAIGQLVQEWVRIVPRNLGLTVALEENLERIERVDATSAFASIDVVSSVVTAGEQAADCLLGKAIAPEIENQASSDNKEPSSTIGYQLFSVGGVSITNTNGASEAVKSAVRRLVPELETLLAAKLWHLTSNEGSSRLRVKATLKIDSQRLIERETRRSLDWHQHKLKTGDRALTKRDHLLPTLTSGTQIQYHLKNQDERSIYLMLLGRDSGGNAIALYSPAENESATDGGNSLIDLKIAPGETFIFPQPNSISSTVAGPPGLAEIQLIFSQAPFTNTLKALSARQHFKGEPEVLDLPNALEVAHALLEDLHATSRVSADLGGAKEDSYALDVNAWAGLNFIYQVV